MDLSALTALGARHLESFLLVFFRLGGMLAFAPVLGHRSIPMAHRAGFGLLLSLVLTPVVGPASNPHLSDSLGLILAIAGELFIGVVIGFVAHLAFSVVEIAGEVVGTQMGLSVATVFDPTFGEQSNVLARFHNFLALLLFLSLNGHHLLIQVVGASFRRIRPGAALVHPEVAGGMVALGGKVLRSGLELAAPLIGILLVLNVSLALLARVAPQTNVFVLGLPLGLGLGFFGLMETLPFFGRMVATLTAGIVTDLDTVLSGASHGLR